MKKILLENAAPGMILAQKILRDDGVLLAQKGAEITEPLIRMLSRMNFETVAVEEEETETPEERAERIDQEIEAIEKRFVRVAQDPVLAALKKALIQKLTAEN
jgi:coenzyme F420-reducing hydrogenase beta subunit